MELQPEENPTDAKRSFARRGAAETCSGQSPPAATFSDPRSIAIAALLAQLDRALRSFKVYARNNEILKRHEQRSAELLSAAFGPAPEEFTISVREDRLLHGRDVVLLDGDRETGLPFILYRNAFRRLSFVPGMDGPELSQLLAAVAGDGSFQRSAEELVTVLWRLALPHLRYLTIDALSVDKRTAEDPIEREKIERLQGDIEGLVARLYRQKSEGEDLVAGLSITVDDLAAMKLLRDAPEALDVDLSQPTARQILPVEGGELSAFAAELAADDAASLTVRNISLMLQVLFLETSAEQSKGTVELILKLFDGLLLRHHLSEAAAIAGELAVIAEDSEDMRQLHTCRLLLRLFAAQDRVVEVVSSLASGVNYREVAGLLRALGPDTVPAILSALGGLNTPGHRRSLCALISELGLPPAEELIERMKEGKWFVSRDLLGLLAELPPAQAWPGVQMALAHSHPKLRVAGLGMLRGYDPAEVDPFLLAALDDADQDVRLAAYRATASQRSERGAAVIEARLRDDPELPDRDPRELRTMTAAYASVRRLKAVPLLDTLLNAGLFQRQSVEIKLSAAFALSSLGPAADDALRRGSRSLSARVRQACRRALSRHLDNSEALAPDPSTMDLAAIDSGAVDITELQAQVRNAMHRTGPQPRREASNAHLEPKSAPHDILATRPPGQLSRDIIPEKLPPAPGQLSQDVPTPASYDIIPERLPPAPGALSGGVPSPASYDIIPEKLPPAPGAQRQEPLGAPPAREELLSPPIDSGFDAYTPIWQPDADSLEKLKAPPSDTLTPMGPPSVHGLQTPAVEQPGLGPQRLAALRAEAFSLPPSPTPSTGVPTDDLFLDGEEPA